MTVDDFVRRIEDLTEGVETATSTNAWQFAGERLVTQLREEIGPSNLRESLSWMLQGSIMSILANEYILYQNYGVRGAEADRSTARRDDFSNRVHAYGTKMPPARSFATYTRDPGGQFAIAKTVYKYGIRPKGWFTKDSLAQDYIDYSNEFIQNNLT